MTITGISGDIGSGKSWLQLRYGLEQCNFKRKYLVTNFGLNLVELKKYCVAKKQWWNVWMIETGQFSVVSITPEDGSKENLSLVPLFKNRKNSVVLLDEAGIFLNSRNFRNTPAQLLMDLAQSRKDGNDLIWAAQFDTQVDVQFRMLTQFWVQCDGWTAYDLKMKRPKLVWKTYFYFKGAEYQRWQSSAKARTSFIRTMFAYAFKTEFGPLNDKDRMLFSSFNSFTRLEAQAQNAREHQGYNLRSEDSLVQNQYFKQNYQNTLRAAVKSGRGRFKTEDEKKAIAVVERPTLPLKMTTWVREEEPERQSQPWKSWLPTVALILLSIFGSFAAYMLIDFALAPTQPQQAQR